MEELPPKTEQEDILQPERLKALKELSAEYLDSDDVEFLDGLDDEDGIISYVYGRLLEQGKDPDAVLAEYGVIEGGEGEV